MTENESKRTNALADTELGIGTWSWGDRLFWGFGRDYAEKDIREAFNACLAAGVDFFDTAEVYAQGKSEQYLGEFMRESGRRLRIATKFFPFPWRLSRGSLLKALRGILKRLDLSVIDLYQIHQPFPPVNIETWMHALADAVQAGLTRTVGVSNYDRAQMQRAYSALVREGVPLASNQVEFHLLNRKAEKSGLLKDCQEIGAVLIAYSPIASGILSGKYTPQNPPRGIRARTYSSRYLAQIQPLLLLLKQIGADHQGKTPAQVALNWVICKGALPIPGVKDYSQAEQNLGATGWRLTEEEVARMDETSDRILAQM